MREYLIKVTEDQAIVLFEYFNRFNETYSLKFEHTSEYIALENLAGQIDETTPAVFESKYKERLEQARNRLAEGFEGDVPNMKNS